MAAKVDIAALGAKWGRKNEDTFRQETAELLKEAGYEVKRELLYNSQGYVFGEPSDIEMLL